MHSRQKSQFLKRLRLHEALESRCLLASITGDSPWQNPLEPADMDCDSQLTASDVILAINAINAQGSGALHGRYAPSALQGQVIGAASAFLDASGDGELTAMDPLVVINAINAGQHYGWPIDISLTDQQPAVAGSSAQTVDISNGFAKVRSAINSTGDVDVFQVAPTKSELNISLISGASGIVHVSVVTVNLDDAGKPVLDSDGNPVTTEISSTSTQSDSHQPAKLNLDVKTDTTYYVIVRGDTGVTGAYALALLNYNMGDFVPVTDSPLGADNHGNTIATATVLSLNHGHAEVTSNIDSVTTADGPDKDFFQITAVNGKLAVSAGAEFPLSVSILDSAGAVKGTITSSDRSALVLDVTAGTYYVSVAAANGTDTGAYHLTVANATFASLPGLGHGFPGHPQPPTSDHIFAKLDTDGSATVSPAEWEAGIPFGHTRIADAVFNKLDSNQDGTLSLDEFMAGLARLHLPGLNKSGDDDQMVLPPIITNH
jgi:hypothetical protein